MKDILEHILPFISRYLQNLLLIVHRPFTVFSQRVRDPRYFKDSILFLWISCVICALAATLIFGLEERTYIEILLGASGVAVTVLFIAFGMLCSWWLVGYRGRPGAIMMPFIYAGGSLVFCSTILAIFGFGALKIYAPNVFTDIYSLLDECRFGSSGTLGAAQGAAAVGQRFDGPLQSIAVVIILAIMQVFLTLSTVIGAYRTAYSVHRLSNRFLDAGLFCVSITFVIAALFLDNVFSVGIDGNVVAC